jgi:hypothetical protein
MDRDRARAAVEAWRSQNPTGTYEQVVTALGQQFHEDYGPVLRALLYVIDKHRAHEITGVLSGTAGAVL